MFETMYAEEGIGLAATQVDIHQRIIVIDVSENRDERLVLINPELLEKSGETGIVLAWRQPRLISINVSLLLMFRKTVTNGWC
ncbi:peptide deformylase [Escherichia coli]|uniref:peptide deformylase n=1 Tax=Escherichia coli TaxID=562 RepID=UPI003D812FD6